MTVEIGTDACEDNTVSGAVHSKFEELYGEETADSAVVRGVAHAVAAGILESIRDQIADGEAVGRVGSDLAGIEVDGGGGGAPDSAQYIVASAHGSLTAERVATDTATVGWDFSVAGQAKANVPDATTSDKGAVRLCVDGVLDSTAVVVGDDERLYDARDPTAHALSHGPLGSDPIRLDELKAPNDNTDLDADDTRHGLLPKFPNSGTQCLGIVGGVVGPWIDLDSVDLQSFTSAGSFAGGWSKPSRGTWAMIICTGAGGGGGGGASATGANPRSGGSGGGGGAKTVSIVPLFLLGSTEDVLVGTGGTGGSGTTVDGTDGNNGGITRFGTTTFWGQAGGGGGGRRGTATNSNGQGGGGGGSGASGTVGLSTLDTNEGGPGRANVTAGTEAAASGGTGCRGGHGATLPLHAEWGGAGGGGRSSAGVTHPGGTSLHGGGGGGQGGFYSSGSRDPKNGGVSGDVQAGGGETNAGVNSAVAGATATVGTGGTVAGHEFESGGGGGGGGGSSNSSGAGAGTTGAVGGNGAAPGGGGGGGGAGGGGAAASSGGNGGDGAAGAIHVFCF